MITEVDHQAGLVIYPPALPTFLEMNVPYNETNEDTCTRKRNKYYYYYYYYNNNEHKKIKHE